MTKRTCITDFDTQLRATLVGEPTWPVQVIGEKGIEIGALGGPLEPISTHNHAPAFWENPLGWCRWWMRGVSKLVS